MLAAVLRRLHVARAEYSAVAKEQCTDDTRVDIRKRVAFHLTHTSQRFIFLHGPPGTGKTAITKSVATQLHEEGRLAASFFFDKGDKTRGKSSSDMFVTTLASQLANTFPQYRSALAKLLSPPNFQIPRSLDAQLQQLILDPLQSTNTPPATPYTWVIVLDGLDECGSPRDLDELIRLVVKLESLPDLFKVFVSCRPEREILEVLSPLLNEDEIEDISNIPRPTNNLDIHRFVMEKISAIVPDGSLPWPPLDVDINRFVRRCGGLFEIAAVRIRQIEEGRRGSSLSEVFNSILRGTENVVPSLANEYARILQRGYMNETTTSQTSAIVRERYYLIVGAFLVLRWPLSLRDLAILVGVPWEQAKAAVRPLSSVLHFTEGNTPLRTFHATFSEYLLGQDGVPFERSLRFDGPQHHILAKACLGSLNRELQQETIKPRMSYWTPHFPRRNNEDRSSRLRHVPAHIMYACAWWAYHTTKSSPSADIQLGVEILMLTKLPFWVELCRHLTFPTTIKELVPWYQVSKTINVIL